MNIYNFFANKENLFAPKTPNSALKAVTTGALPKEYFIYISNFLYSPFETPGKLKTLSEEQEIKRLSELERILAKEELDLDVEVLLIYTLEKLGKHSNAEIALFAAESINSIENKYNKEIYNLKLLLEKNFDIEYIKKLILLYYQYGYINRSKEDIRSFYYNEALNYFNILDEVQYINKNLLVIKIKLLNQLKRFEESRNLLKEYKDILPVDFRLLLSIEIEYEDRNFDKIYNIVNSCNLNSFSDDIAKRISIWKTK